MKEVPFSSPIHLLGHQIWMRALTSKTPFADKETEASRDHRVSHICGAGNGAVATMGLSLPGFPQTPYDTFSVTEHTLIARIVTSTVVLPKMFHKTQVFVGC